MCLCVCFRVCWCARTRMHCMLTDAVKSWVVDASGSDGLQPSPYALHPAHYSLHPATHTLHPTPFQPQSQVSLPDQNPVIIFSQAGRHRSDLTSPLFPSLPRSLALFSLPSVQRAQKSWSNSFQIPPKQSAGDQALTSPRIRFRVPNLKSETKRLEPRAKL